MSITTLFRHPNILSLFLLLKYFSDWKKYITPGRNSVADKIPWITFSAIDFLKKISHPEMKVFEYGSGGSTFFWASRVKSVISVEHDRLWYDRIKMELDHQKINNAKYILKEPVGDPEYSRKNFGKPSDYISMDKNYDGKNFRDYVQVIDENADNSFDIIVVDGRARPSCILHSLKKIKIGGYLVVDNSERHYYLHGFNFSGWKVRHFFGPVPYGYGFSRTTIFQKIQL